MNKTTSNDGTRPSNSIFSFTRSFFNGIASYFANNASGNEVVPFAASGKDLNSSADQGGSRSVTLEIEDNTSCLGVSEDSTSRGEKLSANSDSSSGIFCSFASSSESSKEEILPTASKEAGSDSPSVNEDSTNQNIFPLNSSEPSYDPCFIPDSSSIDGVPVNAKTENLQQPLRKRSSNAEKRIKSIPLVAERNEGFASRQGFRRPIDNSEDIKTADNQHANDSKKFEEESEYEELSDNEGVPRARQIDVLNSNNPADTAKSSMQQTDMVDDDDSSTEEIHNYFEIQRLNVSGRYKPGPVGSCPEPIEFERLLKAMVEKGELRSTARNEDDTYGLVAKTTRFDIHCHGKEEQQFTNDGLQDTECKDHYSLQKEDKRYCHIDLEEHEKRDPDEDEYVERRKLSSYDKYTGGQLYFNPMPLDDMIESVTLTNPKVCWICPDIASEYNADTFSAVVPFENEMKEDKKDVQEEKDDKKLKEKFRDKFRKIKQFFKRRNRKVAPECKPFCVEDQLNEDKKDPELFFLRINGNWNVCYEAETTEEETNKVFPSIISIGKYEYPEYDNVRRRVVRSPGLWTIEEEDEVQTYCHI